MTDVTRISPDILLEVDGGTENLVPVRFTSYASSKPFKLVVRDGKRQEEFFIHADLLAKQSRKFDIIVNHGWKESKNGCVFLEDDLEIFRLFGDFVYSGTYDIGQPTKRPEGSVPEGSASVKAMKYWRFTDDEIERSERARFAGLSFKNKLGVRWSRLLELNGRAPGTLILKYRGDEYDYTELLLTHAKVYIFADYHGVKALEKLALQKICDILCLVCGDPTSAILPDFLKLAKYAFANTVDKGDTQDALREVVVRFTSCTFRQLWPLPEYSEFVIEHPEVSTAVFHELRVSIAQGRRP